MKRKHIRTIAIVALVLLLAVTALVRLEIEPATPSVQDNSTGNVAAETLLHTEKPTAPAQPSAAPAASEEDEPAVPAPVETETPETAPPVETPAAAEATPAPEPAPAQPERHVCTIEIRCDTVTDTSKLENPSVAPFVPADGAILGTTEMEFTPGESVFDILLRATRERNIHLEFRDDNLYSGKYVEGINYLYVFDAGPLSGWMYQVNGLFPNYGCAAYEVNDGDAIAWLYTCDLGTDVGDNSIW